jgi:hypothetical protein
MIAAGCARTIQTSLGTVPTPAVAAAPVRPARFVTCRLTTSCRGRLRASGSMPTLTTNVVELGMDLKTSDLKTCDRLARPSRMRLVSTCPIPNLAGSTPRGCVSFNPARVDPIIFKPFSNTVAIRDPEQILRAHRHSDDNDGTVVAMLSRVAVR